MVHFGEGRIPGDIGHDLLETTFNRLVRCEILNAAAIDAHEVVVMSAQPLSQLVPGEAR